MDKVEQDPAGSQIVGWYHTHPAFGLFLSEYDLFIHRNFFADPAHDRAGPGPVAGELGWFGYEGEGITELGRERTRPPSRHSRGRRRGTNRRLPLQACFLDSRDDRRTVRGRHRRVRLGNL